ncbi:hypothetical protein [Nonomuraea ceibae]|uniref:hypothetical protein n=1 Tax=Nonomuraea ceibae TaxID=1935170 RepID=UPI001C5FB897|nr:hypothetical protein [Nonomuraea ceibae]
MRYFSETGWTAIFSGTETETGRMRPVEAWHSATGVALVVDPQRGALRPVTDWPDFSHLEQGERVVSVIPGGGWRAHWNEGYDGTPVTEEVLAWLIHADGRATPISVEPDGDVTTAELADRILALGQDLD